MATIEQLIQERTQKIEQLQQQGKNPFPATTQRTHTAKEFKEQHTTLEESKEDITLVGRVTAIRNFGKMSFIVLRDQSEDIQCVFQATEEVQEQNSDITLLDIGDFLEATGKAMTTRRGEPSLQLESSRIITKAIRPLPEKWHGLKNEEERYRKRYIETITDRQAHERFMTRSKFIQEIRTYWQAKDFIEVETPILEHVPGGAEAEPFITHHNTLDIDLYLRISLELHHKQLLVGGYERIFEVGRVFRNEGMSTQHLQEFTMIELYWTYKNYTQLLEETEEFLKTVIKNTFGTLQTPYKDTVLNWETPWKRIDYTEAFKEATGITISEATKEDLLTYAKEQKIEHDDKMEKGRLVDTIYKNKVRKHIVQPTILMNHPVDVSPLSKRRPENPETTERFQIIVTGAEVYNAFSELNDPIDQRQRFQQQEELRKKGDAEAYMMNEDFLEALEHGMPPTAGMGMGIDRMLAILMDQPSVRDVVFFPTMKQK